MFPCGPKYLLPFATTATNECGTPQLGACTIPYVPLSISYALLYKLWISIISYCSASWKLQTAGITEP